jgi:predicted RNA polymerase sigma factor
MRPTLTIFVTADGSCTPRADARRIGATGSTSGVGVVCGTSTADIASALLVSEPTRAARLTRPYAVLTVVHLLATTGQTR